MSGPIYLDTSAAVAAHTPESAMVRVQSWLAERDPSEVAISPWVETEFESALALKVRMGKLSLDERALVLAEWRRFRDLSIMVLPIDMRTFETAASYAARHELGVRAGDALHLAVASSYGCSLATLDQRMVQAAPELGVPVVRW